MAGAPMHEKPLRKAEQAFEPVSKKPVTRARKVVEMAVVKGTSETYERASFRGHANVCSHR